MEKHTANQTRGQGSTQTSEVVADLCYRFVRNLLHDLHAKMDRRLVQTFLDVLLVIVMHRHRNPGLLLSELGGVLLGGEHAPAGTKRISNLLHSESWEAKMVDDYLWQQADQAIDHRFDPQEPIYVIWDESVIEKPESLKAWQCSRGKRSLDFRLIYDARRRLERKTGIVFLPVHVPDFPSFPLTLVVSRPGKGRKPWYLLTNEPIATIEEAWRVVLAYNRRWQIEMSLRYSKSELAFESPRLLAWEHRAKLLALAALVQAFLFSLLDDLLLPLRKWLLDHWCHRTGKRSRSTAAPLYLLRLALSQLWLSYRPLTLPRLNPG